MNKFQEIKRILKNEEVVQRYLGLPEKHTSIGNWYKSPFRREKTASFLVSSKGIHDFGDSQHYDIISFVQRYFNINAIQALQMLCNDFGISLENEYETRETLQMLKKKREEERLIKERVANWYNLEMQKISDEIIINQKCINRFKNKSNFEVLAVLYNEQIKLELYFETLFNLTEDEKVGMYVSSI